MITKEIFLKTLCTVLQKYGFIKKGQHYYYNCRNDILCVIGLLKSNFGNYYYIEYGFAIRSLNPKMPYPKFSELDINCGRVTVNQHEAICYEGIDLDELKNELNRLIPVFIQSGENGVGSILKNYEDKICYMIGSKIADYLEIDRRKFNIYPDSLWN